MAQHPRNRWKSGTRGAPAGMSARGLYLGRAIFTLLTLVLIGVLVARIIQPKIAPRVWFVTVTGLRLQDQGRVSLPLPPSMENIPESSGNQPVHIDQVSEELSALKVEKSKRTKDVKDTLTVYVTAMGVDHPEKGPCLVTSLPGEPRQDGSKAEHEKESDVEHSLLPVKDFLNSVLRASEPIGTVIVTLDCSRTLGVPRWGWAPSGGFSAKALEKTVKEINDPRLWVMGATDGELGIWKREQSFPTAFRAARDQLLDELDSRQRHVSLNDFFAELKTRTKKLSNDRMNPWLIHAVPKDAALSMESPAVAWYPAKDRPSPAARKSKSDAKTDQGATDSPKKDTADQGKPQVDSSPAIPSNIFALWKLCDELEAFRRIQLEATTKKVTGKESEESAGAEPKEADPRPELQPPERSPLLFAPHLWRRLKAELVALEFHALAGRAPQNLSKYEDALQALATGEFGSGEDSEEVFDYIQKVGGNYRASAVADVELADACRSYAEALYVAVELIQLEERLAGVSNVDQFSLNSRDLDFAGGVALLQAFSESAFPHGNAVIVASSQVDAVKQTGAKLKAWTQNALRLWTEFGDQQMNGKTTAATEAAAWLTLDVLLTSGLWPAETRENWRAAQRNWDHQNVRQLPLRTRTGPGSLQRWRELAKIAGTEVPAGDGAEDWTKWWQGLPRHLAQRKSQQKLSGAHFLATLCDQRDWKLGEQPFWIGPTIRSAPPPELITLSPVKEPPPKLAATGDDQKAPAEAKTPEYNLDGAEQEINVRIKVERKRKSEDGKTLPEKQVKLQAEFNPDWLEVADQQPKVVTFKAGESEKEVSWTVRMAGKRERQSSADAAEQSFVVDFAKEFRDEVDAQPEPKALKLSASKVAVPVRVRNRRAVVLSCRDDSVVNPVDPMPQDHVFRIELPASQGCRRTTKWQLTNHSPVEVTVDVKLYQIPPVADPQAKPGEANWRWPWGRVPMGETTGAPLREWFEKSNVPKTEVANATLQLGMGQTKLLPWKAAGDGGKSDVSAAKPASEADVTHGLCCLIKIHDAANETRSWMELIPISPREELSRASADLKGELAYLDDNQARFQLPSALKEKSLEWRVERDGRWTSDILRQFPTEKNGNNNQVFLDVDQWPRAFHWSVPTAPQNRKLPVELLSGQKYWIMFQRLEFPAEGAPVAYDRLQPDPRPGDKFTVKPWPRDPEKPLIFQYSPDQKLSVSLEADALSTSFSSLEGESAEIRLEEVRGKSAVTHFARRADRDWTTNCQISPREHPDALQFKSVISDFKHIPLDTHPGLIELRAGIYRSARDSAPAEQQSVKLLFDGSNPTLAIKVLQEASTDDGRINVSAEWDDGADGSGVKRIEFGISLNDKDELKDENVLDFHEPQGTGERKKVMLLRTAEIKENRTKPRFVIAKATDYSGRSKTVVSKPFDLPIIREPAPGGQPKDKPGKKLDGEIRGQLLTPNGNPVSGTTFIVELQGGDTDRPPVKTSNGSFKFEGLDRDTEYSISVPSRQYQNVGRLELPETKLKPKPPNSLPVRLKLQKEK